MKKRHNFLWVITAMVLVAFAFSKEFLPATHPDNTLSSTLAGTSAADATDLHFINVGQGDAELIVCGEDAVLIDGGKASAGSTVVDYLSRQGIAELDAVIATHPHEDHIGGLINVLDAFQVDAFYMSDEAMDTDIYENLLDAIDDEGIQPQFPDIGDVIPIGDSGAKLTVLAPGPDSADTYSKNDPNTWSLVCRLDANGCSALFTGDTTAAVEKTMLRTEPHLLNCDVLKVAHHGSRTASSKDFIQAVSPSYAVISYAQGNSYGLPNNEVFEYLKPLGTKIYETAKDGTVVLQLKNGQVSVAS